MWIFPRVEICIQCNSVCWLQMQHVLTMQQLPRQWMVFVLILILSTELLHFQRLADKGYCTFHILPQKVWKSDSVNYRYINFLGRLLQIRKRIGLSQIQPKSSKNSPKILKGIHIQKLKKKPVIKTSLMGGVLFPF